MYIVYFIRYTFYDFYLYMCFYFCTLISLILSILFSSAQYETFQLNVTELLHNSILIIRD